MTDGDDLRRNLTAEFALSEPAGAGGNDVGVTSAAAARGQFLQVFLRVRPFTAAELDSGEDQVRPTSLLQQEVLISNTVVSYN